MNRTTGEPEQNRSPSRRTFLKAAAVGSAAAAVGVGTAPPALAADEERYAGRMTIAALPRLVVAAPVGMKGNTSWTVKNTLTETVKLSVGLSETISLKQSFKIEPFDTSFGFLGGGISFGSTSGGSTEYKQGLSTTISDAVAIARSSNSSFATAASAADGYNTADDTVFVYFAQPVVDVYRLYTDGQPTNTYRYVYVSGGVLATRTARQLRTDAQTIAQIGAAARDMLLSLYPLLESDSANDLGLLSWPRYALRLVFSPGASFSLDEGVTGSETASEEEKLTTTITITDSNGVTGGGVTEELEVGDVLEETISGAVELATEDSLTIAATGLSGSTNVHYLLEDQVFNAFDITNEGAGTLAVAGRVRGADRGPLRDAKVVLMVGDVPHVAQTDQTGRYLIRAVDHLDAGRYRLTCNGIDQAVSVGKVTRRLPIEADFTNVRPGPARVQID